MCHMCVCVLVFPVNRTNFSIFVFCLDRAIIYILLCYNIYFSPLLFISSFFKNRFLVRFLIYERLSSVIRLIFSIHNVLHVYVYIVFCIIVFLCSSLLSVLSAIPYLYSCVCVCYKCILCDSSVLPSLFLLLLYDASSCRFRCCSVIRWRDMQRRGLRDNRVVSVRPLRTALLFPFFILSVVCVYICMCECVSYVYILSLFAYILFSSLSL